MHTDPGKAEGRPEPAAGAGAGEPDRPRLQKALARAGVGSRRRCEELIAAGRVRVGAETARLGTRVDPTRDVIRVDGRRIPTAPGLVHLALNKPRGVHATMAEQAGRPSLAGYVADRPERLFHVGRLDADTEGLLVLTNDGELAHRLTHPSYEVSKTYLAEVPGTVSKAALRRLRDGVELDDGPARVDTCRVLERVGSRAMVEVTLHEGRNRLVRRLLDAVGHPVRRLVRTHLGPLSLGSQPPGTLRELTHGEAVDLYAALDL